MINLIDNEKNIQEVEVCAKLRTKNPFCAIFLVVDDADEYLLPKQLLFTKLNQKNEIYKFYKNKYIALICICICECG